MHAPGIAATTAIVLATALYASAAVAAAGGGAAPMPMTSFTDLPSYHPNPVRYPRSLKCLGKHARWHQPSLVY